LARKGSNMITGLRTELMNIKTEVTKMMVPRANEQPARQFRCDRSDTSSVSELSESVERCSRNLKTKVSVRDKFVEMELESLQAELKSFKRKYHSKKEQHKEEVDRLNRKIQLLQDLLQ
jgi:predicted RNase H-like nuclease (RuvC/YqgF family)